MSPAFEALFDRDWLRELRDNSVSRETVAEVLARVVAAAPDPVPRVDIADGTMLNGAAKLPHGSVSRASSALLRMHLLQEQAAVATRPGRPIVPLRLGEKWALAGVKIRHQDGHPIRAVGVLMSLDGTHLSTPVTEKLTGCRDDWTLVDTVAYIVDQLKGLTSCSLLGLGVGLGGRMYQGPAELRSSPLREALSTKLQMLTVVENAVNARAVWEVWKRDPQAKKLRFPQSHFALVAVANDWVSNALVINRKVHRGGHGIAGGIGHLTVDYARPYDDQRPRRGQRRRLGFDDPCTCAAADPGRIGYGMYGHVNALATPARIEGELGIPFNQAARRKADADARVASAFRTAGEALGRGIGAVLDIANPARVLLLLPPALAQAEPGTAAAEYKAAVERAADKYSFSSATGADGSQSTLIIEDMDSDDDVKGARDVAACVLDSFIAYARGEEAVARLRDDAIRDGRVLIAPTPAQDVAGMFAAPPVHHFGRHPEIVGVFPASFN